MMGSYILYREYSTSTSVNGLILETWPIRLQDFLNARSAELPVITRGEQALVWT
jgi:hypothetical protein